MALLLENCRVSGREASVLVEDGLISSVSYGSIAPREGTGILDGQGGTLLPGLIDSHCHPFGLGWLRRNLDLNGTTNVTAIRLRLYSRMSRARPGEWVVGRGWDQEALSERRMPHKDDVDDLSPNNPVLLTRVCGHIALLNTAAIEALGLQGAMGPEYERDADGRLTGIVKETALDAVLSRLPRTAESAAAELLAAEFEAAKKGLTMLHCILSPGSFREELDALALLHEERRLSLRYRVYIPFEALDYVDEKGFRAKLGDGLVRINGVKLFADGSLGARTAALREPYSDDPGNYGILRHADEELSSMAAKASEKGYQVIIHAIGDRAVEQAADALSPIAGQGNRMRHRIEHASLIPKDLRQRVASLGLGCAVQPSFIVSDAWARERLGYERAESLYPLRSILNAGIVASGSSDAPVESISPISGVWAAMVRAGYGAGEELTQEVAVALYTTGSATNGLDGAAAGRVQEGMWADLTLLDSDIGGLHPAMLRKVGVAGTVVAGSAVYSYGAP